MKNMNTNYKDIITSFVLNKIHVKVFENFIKNARTDRYNLVCSIDAHEKEHPSPFNDGNSDDGYTLPSNSTTE